MSSDQPSASGEIRPLAARPHKRATERHEELAQQAEHASAARARQHETSVHLDARSKANAVITGLEGRLSAAAEQGRFECQVWTTGLHAMTEEVLRRAFQYVADYLEERGVEARITERKEDIPDYGRDWQLTLTASWETPDIGSQGQDR